MKIKFSHSFVFILLFVLSGSAQESSFSDLLEQEKWDTIPRGKAVIYGRFMQGEGFKSEGEFQFIQILNITSNKRYSIRVKGRSNDSEGSPFMYVVLPGKYQIIDYRYSTQNVLVTTSYTNNLFPSPDVIENDQDWDTLPVKNVDGDRISFELSGRSLNYVGTWDFRNKSKVVFKNEKEALDPEFKKYKKLDFTKARTVIPAPSEGFLTRKRPGGYLDEVNSDDGILINRLVEKRRPDISPFFGRTVKSMRQLNADKLFIDSVLSACKCSNIEASKLFSQKAWNAFNDGKNETASRLFNRSWLLDSMNYSVYWGFGNILESQCRFVEAIPLYEKAYNMDSDKRDKVHAFLCVDYASALTDDHKTNKHADVLDHTLELLKEAESIDGGYGKTFIVRSQVLLSAGRYPESLKAYDTAVLLDPKLADKDLRKDIEKHISK